MESIANSTRDLDINMEELRNSVLNFMIKAQIPFDLDDMEKTPTRVANTILELTAGYRLDPEKVINNAFYKVKKNSLVMVKDISFFSLCAHHMLPFMGKVHVAYIPNGKVIGLSKIPRIVDMFSKRLQLQEQMTSQIATLLNEKLNAQGVAVLIEGSHMCAKIRGIQNPSAILVSSVFLGKFESDSSLRNDFFSMVNLSSTKNNIEAHNSNWEEKHD